MRPTSFFTPVRAGLLTVGLLGAACGDDSGGDDKDTEVRRDSGTPTASKDSGTFQCSDEGKTSSCICSSNKAGTRSCKNGSYTGCTCNSAPDAGRSNVSQCKPGYYTGKFTGDYRPGAFGFGLFGSGFEVQISGGSPFFAPDTPGLAFSLNASVEAGGEVGLYTVGGGCLQGVANAVVVTQSPFVARLEGDLDCATGEFNGTLTGYYTLIGIGPDYSFTGPVTGHFDIDSSSIDDGAWKVDEPAALDGNPQGGGEGNWNAMWTADTAPVMAVDPCASVGPNGEHITGPGVVQPNTDAGAARSDAGTP